MLYTENVCKTFSEFQTITNQNGGGGEKAAGKNRSLPAVQTQVAGLAENALQKLPFCHLQQKLIQGMYYQILNSVPE